ncbi:SDR family NAD(P)-dependent oxidoreductase [Microbacterium sp. P06]|uniref:SDR family NAD(P)-dependent oxidoreductase n=1 Tax=Microbacterium sp. P06 TaxID=3366949 RepID=UPI0037463002
MQTRTFGPDASAIDVVEGLDLGGRSAIVTGSSSGIGVETARAFATAGANVTLAVRDIDAGRRTAASLRAATGNSAIAVVELDLADLASVRSFSASWSGPLHFLINNAGIMHAPELRTDAGWEMQMAVNHLGHFALATELLPALAEAGDARIVSVSSSGHASSGIRFDDMFFQRDVYDPGLAYGQSKTANVLFALEATKRWAPYGVTAAAVMPGGIWTNLQRYWDPVFLADMKRRYPTKTPAQGAATSVWASTRAEVTPGGPVYFEDCRPARVVTSIADGLHGVLPHALDPAAAERLWDVSAELVGGARNREGSLLREGGGFR